MMEVVVIVHHGGDQVGKWGSSSEMSHFCCGFHEHMFEGVYFGQRRITLGAWKIKYGRAELSGEQ